MKSILLSIKPKYVELIARGEKTIEVRKTAPQEVPFKCYIYCTYGNMKENYCLGMRGKVIGEFVCDKVDEYPYDYCDGVDIDDDTILETSIDREDINIYAKGKTLYGWHISDLKIYDKPRELWDFVHRKKYDWWDYGHHTNKPQYEWEYISRPPQSWQYVKEREK